MSNKSIVFFLHIKSYRNHFKTVVFELLIKP